MSGLPFPEPESFKDLLKVLREGRGLNKVGLTRALKDTGILKADVHSNSVGQWESGTIPSAYSLEALRKFYDIDNNNDLKKLWISLHEKAEGSKNTPGRKKGKNSQSILARQADIQGFLAPVGVYFYDDSDLLSLVAEFRKTAFGQSNSAEINTAFNHVLAAVADFITGQAYFPEMKGRLVEHVLAHFREDDNFSRIARDYVFLLSHAEKNALLEHGYVAARVLPKLQHADQRRVIGGLLDAMAWATLPGRRWDEQDQEASAPLADELCRLIAEGAVSGVIAASALVQLTAADEVNRARYRLHESQASDLEGLLLNPSQDEILGRRLCLCLSKYHAAPQPDYVFQWACMADGNFAYASLPSLPEASTTPLGWQQLAVDQLRSARSILSKAFLHIALARTGVLLSDALPLFVEAIRSDWFSYFTQCEAMVYLAAFARDGDVEYLHELLKDNDDRYSREAFLALLACAPLPFLIGMGRQLRRQKSTLFDAVAFTLGSMRGIWKLVFRRGIGTEIFPDLPTYRAGYVVREIILDSMIRTISHRMERARRNMLGWLKLS